MEKNYLCQLKEPPLDRVVKLRPKFFLRLLTSGLTLSIAKISTRSGCYTWDTSIVRDPVSQNQNRYFFPSSHEN